MASLLTSNLIQSNKIVATNLIVDNLTVKNANNITPTFPGYISLALISAKLLGTAEFYCGTYWGIYLKPLTNSISWATYVPSSNLPLYIYFGSLDALNTVVAKCSEKSNCEKKNNIY